VEKAIDPSIKGSVVYSIATVIQTLPVERSIGPLVVRSLFFCSFRACATPKLGSLTLDCFLCQL
jgi:hypothetical protein